MFTTVKQFVADLKTIFSKEKTYTFANPNGLISKFKAPNIETAALMAAIQIFGNKRGLIVKRASAKDETLFQAWIEYIAPIGDPFQVREIKYDT